MQIALECKQCGGVLGTVENQKIVYCKYCGSANVVSVADRVGLYNRANYLRRNNEFDRALGVYEDVLKENPCDAEAYYGMALCKYGIEYVDDEKTGRKIPTCHRTKVTLFSQDDDFKKALEYADPDTVDVYRTEADKIDVIIKKIQQISSRQEKYDIFICYKESDENGERTETSVNAQDIYETLMQRGYKVFFARKTLENKLGSDYEPIIFSALYSAKVMLVVGTKKEEFEAVWVRNEWVRFCERLSGGEECTLIPLYKNMSPYDLPAEFVNIQGLDMGKIGFIQDLTDAVKRLIHQETPVQMQVQGNAADPASGANLRKRAYLFLEQGDTQSASQYFERALDVNAEDAEAYWGKMLVELGCRKEEELPDQDTPLTANNNYNMALRFADEEQRQRYSYYADTVQTKLYEKQKAEEEARRIAEEQEQERLRQEQEEKERRKKEREEQEEKRRQKNKVVSKRVLKIALILIVLGILYELILFIPVGIAGGVFLSRVCGRYELAERWVDFAWDSTPVEDEIFDYQLYSRIDDMFDYAACTYLYKYKEMERLGGVWEEELSDDVATTIASHGTFIGISEDGDFVYGCFNDGIFSYSLNDINQYRRYAKKRGKIQTLYRGSGYCDFYIVTQKGELDHIYLDNDNGYKLVIEYNYLGWKDIEEVKRWSGSIPDGEGWYSQGYLFGKKSDGSVCCYNTSTGSKKDETVWVDIGNADSGTYQANIVELDLDELEEHWDDIHDQMEIIGEAD